MNELKGLLTQKNHRTCTVVNDRIRCPKAAIKNYPVYCDKCIYYATESYNHTKLKELIPILLLEE
jgi:hypothetical protein